MAKGGVKLERRAEGEGRATKGGRCREKAALKNRGRSFVNKYPNFLDSVVVGPIFVNQFFEKILDSIFLTGVNDYSSFTVLNALSPLQDSVAKRTRKLVKVSSSTASLLQHALPLLCFLIFLVWRSFCLLQLSSHFVLCPSRPLPSYITFLNWTLSIWKETGHNLHKRT